MKLKGLYYPYSRCVDLEALKKAVLIFDEIYFIDPIERLIREYLLDKDGFGNIPMVSDAYQELEAAGIAIRLNPFPEIRECDKLLFEAAASDEKDEEYRKLFDSEAQEDRWGILKNKYNGAGVIYASPDIEEAMYYAMRVPISEKRAREKGVYGTGRDLSSTYIMKVAHEYVHPALGLALGINHSLVVAEREDLVPFTDSDLAYRALHLKYRRAVANALQAHLRITPGIADDQKFTALAFNVLDRFLDADELARRTVGEVVSFRNTSAEHLARFRAGMQGMAAEIDAQVWDEKFQQGALKTIQSKIASELQRLDDDLQQLYAKMFGGLLKKVASLATPTLLGTVLAGLSPGQILGYSTAAITGALGISVPEFVDMWLERRKLRANTLFFVLDIRRRLGR
jgi:hypothetical protein